MPRRVFQRFQLCSARSDLRSGARSDAKSDDDNEYDDADDGEQEAGDGDDQNLLCGQVRLANLRQNSLQGGLRSLECSGFFWAPEEVRSIDCADFIIIIKIHIILQ